MKNHSPRALWIGTITFGMIHVPVKLYMEASLEHVRIRAKHRDNGDRRRKRGT